jgi:GH25 family lysozyme M1 (1,4-beta-N-acetylmuramidase)
VADLKALPVWGVDVSRWQGTSIDWPQVRAAGATFVFIKATDGADRTDPSWQAWSGPARAAGLLVGGYHFARPEQSDPEQQADQLLAALGTAGEPGWLPPVLDLETAGGLAPDALRAWSRRFLERIGAAAGVPPILYTSTSFHRDQLGSELPGGARLWVAHHTTADGPGLPRGVWSFWQHTDTATVPGITGPVDRDVFDGTPDQLRAVAAGREQPMAPTYGTMRQVMSEGVPGTLTQPVADLMAQLAKAGGAHIGNIGNASHLWNNGSPRTVANRRHGDHTPWSSDGPSGYVKALDVKSIPGITPHHLLTRFLVPTVKAGLYPEYKYGISGYELYDSRPPFNMRKQPGGDGFGHCHLSFRADSTRRHSTIVEDAVAWHAAGRPDPVTFVKNRRAPKEPPMPPDPDRGDMTKYPSYAKWYSRWGGRTQSVLGWFDKGRVRLTEQVETNIASLETLATRIEDLEERVTLLETPAPEIPGGQQ